MPLNGYPVTGDGEVCTMDMAAPNAGTPLPLGPAIAKSNESKYRAAAGHLQGKVVADNADSGDTQMRGDDR
jgi:hypothetical protein